MKREGNRIQVFEFERVHFEKGDEALKDALDRFFGEGLPYFELIRNGVRFKNYVGVLSAGKYTIEVLPKIDRQGGDEATWQGILIDMLRQSGMLKTDAPSSASLRLKSNSILDLYMELFLSECEYLLNRGLIKRYRRTEGNTTALKGALVFGKHLQQNLIHKERFYVRYPVYDRNHELNQILLKTIHLLDVISTSSSLKSRIGSLLLNFPELPDLRVSDATFARMNFDRKSAHYKKAIDIAKLLLLNYHPDIRSGREDVLALMFDMNVLWEKWVLRQLQKSKPEGMKVSGQSPKDFWIPSKGFGYAKTLRPDILIEYEGVTTVLDTKWKIPKDNKPADADLKQMFAYNKRYNSKRSILLYPGAQEGFSGSFFGEHGACEVRFLDVVKDGELRFEPIDLEYVDHELDIHDAQS